MRLRPQIGYLATATHTAISLRLSHSYLNICKIRMCICICIHTHTYSNKRIYIYICMYMYKCICVNVFVYMFICMYIHVYIYVACTKYGCPNIPVHYVADTHEPHVSLPMYLPHVSLRHSQAPCISPWGSTHRYMGLVSGERMEKEDVFFSADTGL